MGDNFLQNALEIAVSAARRGGTIIADGFNKKKEITLKGFADPVTQFDKASEKAIIEELSHHFPNHSFLTEEELSVERDSAYKWIIDPIDGTVNFTHRVPFVCVSIGLEIDGKLTLGVIYNPILDELYTAIQGKGAFCNGLPIHVSEIDDIGSALLVTGFPYHREGRLPELLKPLKKVIMDYQGFRRLGSAAMDLAFVASGRADAFYEEGLKPWDSAAGIVLVREAGGIVTDFYNNPHTSYQNTIIASNPQLYKNIQDLTRKVKAPKLP